MANPMLDGRSVCARLPEVDPANETVSAILVDAHLDQFDSIRRPRPLNRLIRRLSAGLFPREEDVRGSIVAADLLLDAFALHGSHCEFFVYPEAKTAMVARLNRLQLDERAQKRIEINSVYEVLGGVDKYRIRTWFNPIPYCSLHGGIEISYGIRNHFAFRPYPITTLLHGLAGQSLLYTVYLRYLLQPTVPCDSIVCTSRASRDSARRLIERLAEWFGKQFEGEVRYNGRFDLIPLCVNTSDLQPRDKPKARRKLKLPQLAFVILYVGKISTTKGDLCPFLRAFHALIRRNPGRQLLWVVAGTESPGYSQVILGHASELGIADHVKVLLNISDEMKLLLFAASDVFVSPVDTLDESFGITVIEAMSSGLPQVVPDWDGYRDTVNHGETGFLTPTYWSSCCGDLIHTGIQADGTFNRLCLGQSIAIDMQETARCIQTLIDSHELCEEMANRSRQRALSLYSFKAVVRQYEELWAELAGVARSLTWKNNNVRRDPLHYFDLFGNYASKAITDDTSLRLTGIGREGTRSDASFPRVRLPDLGFKVLDSSILKRALSRVVANAGHNGRDIIREEDEEFISEQMGTLAQFVASEFGCGLDYARRHIMWLVKYGYLQPVFK